MNITAKIEGKNLVITVPMNEKPAASKTGKTRIVATSHGNVKTDLTVEGQQVTVGLTAYIK